MPVENLGSTVVDTQSERLSTNRAEFKPQLLERSPLDWSVFIFLDWLLFSLASWRERERKKKVAKVEFRVEFCGYTGADGVKAFG